MNTLTPWMAAIAFVGALSLTACGGGGGDSSPQTGSLSIAVTDTPIDTNVTEVNIEFRGLRLKPKSGPAFDIDFGTGNEKTIDLLQLQGTASADLIVNETVPAGEYNWVWLLVNAEKDVMDSWVEIDDSAVFPLYVPSGSQTGLKLVSGFVVPVGGDVDFIIDWNLANAVHAPPGQDPNYLVRPALRITNRAEVGTLTGTVDSNRIDENDPTRCEGGNRVYRRKEIKLVHLIRHLLHTERYTIEGARQKLDQLRKDGKLARASRIAWNTETVRDLRREADALLKLLDS